MKSKNEVIIVGAGPAGMATALQLKRQGMEARLFEKAEPGGLLKNALRVENFLGFPEGISGPELVGLFRRQLEKFNISVIKQMVMEIDYDENDETFSVSIGEGYRYPAGVLVVAIGTRANEWDRLNLMSPEMKKHIFDEVVPLLNEKGKKVIIIGAGDAAFDYALNLSRFNEVMILNRGETIKALPILQDRLKQNPGVKYFKQSTIKSIEPGKVRRLSVVYRYKDADLTVEVDHIIYAIGRVVDKRFYSSSLIKAEEKLISRGRLYLAGDVKNGNCRQVSIAIGNGIQTAMEIYRQWGRA